VIADNKLTLNGEWDLDLLKLELGELKESDFDLGLIGFSDDEIGALLAEGAGLTDPDDAPDAPVSPVSEAADVWLLGKHRLVCGDCTDAVVIARACNGAKIDMVLTDPPYCSGGFQEAGKGSGSVGTRGTEMVANDTRSTRGYMALMGATIPKIGAGVVYIFTDWRMWINLFDVVESSGYGVRNMIVLGQGNAWNGRRMANAT
jgi:hypothetical protein